MVELQLELVFSVRDRKGRPLPPEQLHDEGARLMEALLDLEKCNDNMRDSATSSDTEAGQVTVDFLVSEESDSKAVDSALTLCRTAIHAIGGATPNWPSESSATAGTDFVPTKVEFDYVS
ncbi:hypothetical protein ACQPZX_42700 [Actinoplanes sp. CA-142083]|uniref:hypothetical protein n=1 Tax=Actinoplanes sp. CA-142083 TaxID=3239903 RepID=UPI003D92F529